MEIIAREWWSGRPPPTSPSSSTWGKCGQQLPQNSSLSFTLSQSVTRTRVEYAPRGEGGRLLQQFEFSGDRQTGFWVRVEKYLQGLTKYIPLLQELSLIVHTQNTFPHSCGVASSASAFSALALCLCEIQRQCGQEISPRDFLQRASFLARLGSGSACRSLYGPFALWGKGTQNACDEYAIAVSDVHADFLQLRNAICLVARETKPISSSDGHQLMEGHPFARERYQLAGKKGGALAAHFALGRVGGLHPIGPGRGLGFTRDDAPLAGALLPAPAQQFGHHRKNWGVSPPAENSRGVHHRCRAQYPPALL